MIKLNNRVWLRQSIFAGLTISQLFDIQHAICYIEQIQLQNLKHSEGTLVLD